MIRLSTVDTATRLPVFERHNARCRAYQNGAVWALGNGMASSMLVVYLAMEYDVPGVGLGISLILAAPRLAGLLRLVAPALIGRLADRKQFCLITYLLSSIVLFGLPLVAAPGWLPSARASLWALILLWCLYHLLEYLGTVALWSWLADLVPLHVRGRFLGRRQRWMVTGQAVGMIVAGLFSYSWNSQHWDDRWLGYAIPAAGGAALMALSLVPLTYIPRLASSRTVTSGASLRAMAAPFCDVRFLRLLAFGCWFSFFNGITQFAQGVYPSWVLGFGLFHMLGMKTGMRLGQLALSPWFGRLADRIGNRPLMILTLPIVGLGPLFYFLADAQQPWWIAGAWVMWIAYAGLNVCLPNLMLKLSPSESNTPYIATYYAVTGLCLAVSTILGGTLFDWLGGQIWYFFDGRVVLDYYQCSFLFGWITRTLGVLLLLLVVVEGPPGSRFAVQKPPR